MCLHFCPQFCLHMCFFVPTFICDRGQNSDIQCVRQYSRYVFWTSGEPIIFTLEASVSYL